MSTDGPSYGLHATTVHLYRSHTVPVDLISGGHLAADGVGILLPGGSPGYRVSMGWGDFQFIVFRGPKN